MPRDYDTNSPEVIKKASIVYPKLSLRQLAVTFTDESVKPSKRDEARCYFVLILTFLLSSLAFGIWTTRLGIRYRILQAPLCDESYLPTWCLCVGGFWLLLLLCWKVPFMHLFPPLVDTENDDLPVQMWRRFAKNFVPIVALKFVLMMIIWGSFLLSNSGSGTQAQQCFSEIKNEAWVVMGMLLFFGSSSILFHCCSACISD